MNEINSVSNLNIIHTITTNNIYNKNDLKILYFNIRSIRNKLYDLEQIINDFQIAPDIIVLTEIWIKKEENIHFNLQNYKPFFANRKTSQAGGVAIFVHNNISTSEILNIDEEETSWLGVKLLKLNINLFAIYRSPSSNQEHFLFNFDELLSKTKTNIIVGDFNLDLLKKCQSTTKYVESIEGNGHLLINKVSKKHCTRETSSTATIIDHIITDCLNFAYKIALSDVTISDHKQILINVSTSKPLDRKPKHFEKLVLNYEKIERTNALNNLQDIHNMDDYIKAIKKIVNLNTIKIKLNNTQKKRKIWMKTEIIKQIETRDRLYKLKMKNPHNMEIENLFKKVKNRIKYQIENEKKSFYKSFFMTNASNPKKMWSGIHELIYNNTKQIDHTPNQLHINGKTETEPERIANIFNEFFIKVAEMPSTFRPSRQMALYNTNFDLASPTNETTERNIIQLKKNGANGYDDISTNFIQKFATTITPVITKLMNNHFNEGTYPMSLKVSKIIPIFKSGDKTNPTNFRPIGVQSNFTKIFEQSIKTQFDECLVKHSVIDKNQFGFLPNSSTLSACSQLISNIQHNLDDGLTVICLFIDLKKAFDYINHDLLLYKLRCLGMTNRTYRIFESLIKERMQLVQIAKHSSTKMRVLNGVPQGSILSPSLFNYYINDIFKVNLHGTMQLYADDAVIMCSGKDIMNVKADMENDLEKIDEWCRDNKLTINSDKTKFLTFTKRRTINENITISLKGNNIEEVTSFNYLGLHIDNNLNWSMHINKIKSSLSSTAFAIRRIKNIAPQNILWLMYNSYFLPKLQYLNPIWNNAAEFRLKDLQIIQNRVVKSILSLPHLYPSHLLYNPDTTPSIYQLNKFQTIMYIFKIKHNFIRHNVQLQQLNQIHNYSTRNNEDFFIRKYRTNKGLYSIIANGLREYNKLPQQIKQENRISVFKSMLQNHLYS